MKNNKINLLYIIGHGRSGSTLLDTLLAQIPNFVSFGEIARINEKLNSKKYLCSCGDTFSNCSFFKNFNFENLEDLYGKLSNASNSSWIIDSSKDPNYAYSLLKLKNIQLHLVHLVRDPRAVAFSRLRTKKRKDNLEEEFMDKQSSTKTAIKWNKENLKSEDLKNKVESYVRIRYQDLAKNPKKEIFKILKSLNLKKDLSFIQGNKANLNKKIHAIHGNPDRTTKGFLEIKEDISWKEEMKLRDKVKVSLLTFPLLLKYKFLH